MFFVVGAGPTGLVAASEALRQGLRPNPELSGGGRVFDRLHGTGYSWLVVAESQTDAPRA